ncbi:MAG: hypothetical protein QOF44_4662 [Streptomyces sp.]|jgi:hypothetical protein|nr:hypothetical protein [Streptomyces sp.]
MTSPRGSYGGGYYTSPFFPDTPIYDSLVAERGTPQIAPIRVPSAYDSGSNLPALPSAFPALPPGPSSYQTPAQGTYNGYSQPGYQQQQPPLQQAPAPYIPQQATAQRAPYNGGYQQQQQPQAPYQGPAGYEAARPAAPRPQPPRPAQPGGYDEQQPYQRRNLGQGYYQG